MPKRSKSDISSIAKARQEVVKRYGEGAIVTDEMPPLEVIPTGVLLLDKILGLGGLAKGRFFEISGREGAGKSTVAFSCAKQCQAVGMAVHYVDFENTFDPVFTRSLGVNCDPNSDLWVLSQPRSLEEGLEVAQVFVNSGGVGLVILDSIAAMVSEKEFDVDYTKDTPQVAVRSRALNSMLSRLLHDISASNAIVIGINHTKDAINTSGYGARTTTSGGSAVKFYASARIELAKVDSNIKGKVYDFVSGSKVDGSVATKVRARILKNKTAPVGIKDAEFYLRSGRGICEEYTVFDIAVARDIIVKKGSRFILPFIAESGNYININGQESTIRWLIEHPEQYNTLRAQVVTCLDQVVQVESEVVDDSVPLDIDDLVGDDFDEPLAG